MENFKYFMELLVGKRWEVLAGGMIIMLIIAYFNCFGAKSSGQVFYHKGRGFFVFLSSVAGCFHFSDLIHEWLAGELIIIEDTALENPGSAYLLSFVIAVLFGVVIGVFFYTASQIVILRRTEFIERRYMLSHLRKISRRQQDSYKYY